MKLCDSCGDRHAALFTAEWRYPKGLTTEGTWNLELCYNCFRKTVDELATAIHAHRGFALQDELKEKVEYQMKQIQEGG